MTKDDLSIPTPELAEWLEKSLGVRNVRGVRLEFRMDEVSTATVEFMLTDKQVAALAGRTDKS